MLDIIWPFFIIISIIFAFITGNIENINNSIFESTSSALELTLTLIDMMCLWSGIMEIAENTDIMNILSKVLSPIMKVLFKDIKKTDKEYKEILMNIIANLLGLGNAATPLGLKAMQTMQEKNPDKDVLTDSMAMFIVLNTASLQIIPTTVIAIRSSLGSQNPTKIIFPVWVSGVCAVICGTIAVKIFIKLEKKK